MSNDRCRSCRAPVRWCVTEQGRSMPVDFAPAPGGNLVLYDRGNCTVAVVVKPLLETPEQRARPHFYSHFVTCPNAAQHRRKAS